MAVEKELSIEVGVSGRVAVSPGAKRILVKPHEGADRTAGGIYIPETARKDATTTGTVVAVSPPFLVDGVEQPSAYMVGTQVIFGKFTGQEIDIPKSSDPADRRYDRLIIMWEKDVIAVVEQACDDHINNEFWYVTEGTAEAMAASARRL